MCTKRVLGLLAMLAVLLLAALPVLAITFGEPDNGAHPYVGLVGLYYDEIPLYLCSGTLIAPDVVMTAAHCLEDQVGVVPNRAQVWFDDDVSAVVTNPGNPPSGATGVPFRNPNYRGGILPNTNDVAVVRLDVQVTDLGFGILPSLGYLDRLATQRGKQDVTFTSVGYGLNEVKPLALWSFTRFKAASRLVNLRSALTDGYNLHTSNNPGDWSEAAASGGSCRGDSGGPVLYSNTNTVVGVTSFGLNANCKGADFAYRVDTPAARAFLKDFVTLP